MGRQRSLFLVNLSRDFGCRGRWDPLRAAGIACKSDLCRVEVNGASSQSVHTQGTDRDAQELRPQRRVIAVRLLANIVAGKGPILRPHILRISTSELSGTGETLRLEGHVGGPWIAELRRSCDRVLSEGKQLTLDLSGVSFVDHEGVGLLVRLKHTHVELRNFSPFVSLKLHESADSQI